MLETSEREKEICLTLLRNRRKKIYGPKDGNPLSFEHLQGLISDLSREELEQLVDKRILRQADPGRYEFVNSKISAGINGVAKISLPHADGIGTLTATGMRDFIGTVSLNCQDPKTYKQEFIDKIYKPGRFKPISARDYGRLQGFPEEFQMARREAIARKQFGNAVSVPVVYHLGRSLLEVVFGVGIQSPVFWGDGISLSPVQPSL